VPVKGFFLGQMHLIERDMCRRGATTSIGNQSPLPFNFSISIFTIKQIYEYSSCQYSLTSLPKEIKNEFKFSNPRTGL